MNRRTITASVLAAAALLAVTGCQKQNGIAGGNPLSFSVSVTGQEGTRAVLYNDNAALEALAAFKCRAYNVTKSTVLFSDETVSYADSKWSTGTAYTWQPGETMTFCAYAPVAATGVTLETDGITYSCTVADNAASQTDVMLGYYSGGGNNSGTANIKFDHPFTAVRFKMGDIKDFIPGFTGISSITIAGVYTGGTLDKWSGSGDFIWTPSGDKTVTMTVGGANPTEGTYIVGTDANAEVFTLIPQVMSSKPATITVNYNATVNGAIVATIGSVPTSDNTWKAGKVYTYTVNFKTFDLTISDSVDNWTTDAQQTVEANPTE